MLKNDVLLTITKQLNSITDKIYNNSSIKYNLIDELLLNHNNELNTLLDELDKIIHLIHLNLEFQNYKHSLYLMIILEKLSDIIILKIKNDN